MADAPARYFPIGRDGPGYGMPGSFEPLRPRADRNGAADGHFFQVDDRRHRYLARKAELLALPASARRHRLALPRKEQALSRVRDWAIETLGREHPDLLTGPPPDTLDALVEQVQEDVVVMQRPPGGEAGDAIAIHVHVCFPSGWRPWTILGRDFEQIHAPVPSHDRFDADSTDGRGRARRSLAISMFGQPRVRYVWTVTPDDELSRLPDSDRLAGWQDAPRGTLRVERQVVAPLPGDDLSVFLIRVHHRAFDALTPDERTQLAHAVAAMPEPIARYKGLAGARDRIAELLR